MRYSTQIYRVAAAAPSLELVVRRAGDRGGSINKLKIIFGYEVFSLLRKPVILLSGQWVEQECSGRQCIIASRGSIQRLI